MKQLFLSTKPIAIVLKNTTRNRIALELVSAKVIGLLDLGVRLVWKMKRSECEANRDSCKPSL